MSSNKKWLIGIACFIFFGVLVSYFQFSDTPTSPYQTVAPESSHIFKYQQSPFEPKDLTTAITEGYFRSITKEDIHDIEILTSVKQDDGWILLTKYTVDDGFPYHAIVEVKKRDSGTEMKLLFVGSDDFTGYGHWYDKKYGIGFGSGSEYAEIVQVQTERNQYTSYLHNGYFIYVSDEKPEKITYFGNDEEVVMHEMETFNFDDVYPLLAERDGEYSLLIVDSSRRDWVKFLRKKDLMIANIVQGVKSLEDAKMSYPFLDIVKSPSFMVFDYDEMIFQSYDKETFLAYLGDIKEGLLE